MILFSFEISDKQHLQDRHQHGLRDIPLKDLVAWDYGDYHFYKTRIDLNSTIKIWNTASTR